ncbi:hypothetical protein BFP72_07000 [Reichenbachiella sp. 5M10]|nr:hypothetical protein BFP72_07000 [Reichenbachiella sp. 5M10]
MYLSHRFIVFFIFFIALQSCTKSKKTQIENIDSTLWKKDLENCGSYRALIVGDLDSLNSSLLSLTEEQTIDVLGAPNQTLLYERGQKFYEYKINCDLHKNINQYLRLRINSLGYVSEVVLIERS